MKFVLEILFIFLLFFIIRTGLRRWFPSSKIPIQLSHDSKVSFRKFYRRYILLFIGLGLLGTLMFLFFFRGFFSWIHNSEAHLLYYSVDTFSLIFPALLAGFLMSSLIAHPINNKLQSDGLSFFLNEIQENWEGFSARKIKAWHLGLVLLVELALIFNLSQVYFQVDEDGLSYSKWAFEKSEHPLTEVEEIIKTDPLKLVFRNGDTLNMGIFNYERQPVLEALEGK